MSYLQKALELAKKAEENGDVPVGAIVIFENKIIGSGFNQRENNQDPLGHAEISALQTAAKTLKSWRLNECDLYVTLEPCIMCLNACQQARIRKVVYGAKDEKGGALCLGFYLHEDPRLHHRFEVILEENSECSKILKDFFFRRRQQQKSDKLNS